MGGGESTAPTTPPNYTGGSVMEYTPPAYSPSPVQGGVNPMYGQIAQSSLQSVAKGIGAGASPIPPIGSAPSMGSAQFGTEQQSPSMIPQNQLIEALMRILGGSGGAGGAGY